MFFLFIPPNSSGESTGTLTWTIAKSTHWMPSIPCGCKQVHSTSAAACMHRPTARRTSAYLPGKTVPVGRRWSWPMKMWKLRSNTTSTTGTTVAQSSLRATAKGAGTFGGCCKNSSMANRCRTAWSWPMHPVLIFTRPISSTCATAPTLTKPVVCALGCPMAKGISRIGWKQMRKRPCVHTPLPGNSTAPTPSRITKVLCYRKCGLPTQKR